MKEVPRVAHIERRPNNRYRARYRSPDGREHSQTFRRKPSIGCINARQDDE